MRPAINRFPPRATRIERMSRHIEVIAIAENRPILGSDSDESLEEGLPVCREVQAASVSRRDVQDTRRFCREVPNGRPPCRDVQDEGPSRRDVQDEGPSRRDVQDAGPSRQDVQDAGPSRRDVQDAGPSRREQLQMEIHQPPPSISFWAAFKSVLSDKKAVSAAHWVLTIAVIVLLSAAMLDPWRHFVVDREALLELWRTGRIEGDVINSSLSFSRTQGVLLECYADTRRVTENDTIFFPKKGCDSVMAYSALSGSNTLLVVISLFMLVGVLLFPVIVFLAFCNFFFLGAAACNNAVQRRLTLRFTSGIRLLNSIFCVGFLIPAVVVGHLFQTQDPSFPMHWPQEVRDNTEVTLVGSGAVEWIFGTIFQFMAMFIDMFRARVRLS